LRTTVKGASRSPRVGPITLTCHPSGRGRPAPHPPLRPRQRTGGVIRTAITWRRGVVAQQSNRFDTHKTRDQGDSRDIADRASSWQRAQSRRDRRHRKDDRIAEVIVLAGPCRCTPAVAAITRHGRRTRRRQLGATGRLNLAPPVFDHKHFALRRSLIRPRPSRKATTRDPNSDGVTRS